ncbi:MAG: Undecaprenyl-diphosphatase [Deltaproteobacteria bacterium ADurb.Bin151]|jgi:undecaprenyl-diphosphatase|nr:MAG: Undecaprenyl-diphosphatase [Deltaproteobacteria bacterium ADurb.Bin151]
MDILQAIILSIVEGITEFLPVSSTGHMILASYIMKIHEHAFVKTFEIGIQIGAILAIVMLYYKRFIQGLTIYIKLFIAFIPTAVVGFLAYKTIKTYLFNPLGVSLALIIGGVILIVIDKWVVTRESRYAEIEEISYKNAFFIGLAQCVSMIPGVSRAAATIIGGVGNGLNKKQATEFSFLLAVPTMCAATGYDLLKTDATFSSHELMLLAIGLVGAFISAWLAVKLFIRFVENHGFKTFGYYRIFIGIVFLVYMVLSGSSSFFDAL